MFFNRKNRRGPGHNSRRDSDAAASHFRVNAQVVGSVVVSGATLMLVRVMQDSAPGYCLGVRYDANSIPQTYAGTSDAAVAYRAFLLLVNYLRRDAGPIQRRTVRDYAEDCQMIATPYRSRRSDLSQGAPVSVAVIRDQLGRELFQSLRDMPVAEMPLAIRKLVARG